MIDESNGILVDSMDIKGLTRAMKNIISQYANYDRPAISGKAISQFSYPVIGKKLDDIYSGLVNKTS